MKPFSLLLVSPITLLLTLPNALSADLLCRVKVNHETVSERKVVLDEGTSAFYAETRGFRMRANHRGASKFELEVIDLETPSRGYAEASLRAPEDAIKWTLWTRELLLETSCQLLAFRDR